MRLPRKHRFLTALIALVGMLFMQLAVASYACPGLQSRDTAEIAAGSPEVVRSTTPCEQPDPEQPALCHAHCQDGKSSLSKHESPTVSPAAVFVAAPLHVPEPAFAGGMPGVEPSPSLLQRITAPPISIRHCCFRI
jgi:hypothetical protein